MASSLYELDQLTYYRGEMAPKIIQHQLMIEGKSNQPAPMPLLAPLALKIHNLGQTFQTLLVIR